MSAATSSQRLTATQCFAGMAAVALAYVLFFRLNEWLFSVAKVSDYVSWVFLPAAIRMLAVLLLGWFGVAGLYLGSLSMLGQAFTADPWAAFIIAGISSLPCLLAARLVQRWQGVASDLAGMTGRQLLIMGVAGGLANSAAHTIYFAWDAQSTGPLAGFVPMFVGDTLGTFLMLYLGALVLNRLLRNRGEV